MLDKKKLGKKVYYDGDIWNVRDVISPNKYQDFLLLQIESECSFDDGAIELDMVLVDPYNTTVYPVNKSTKKLIKSLCQLAHDYEHEKGNIRGLLNDYWIDLCGDYE